MALATAAVVALPAQEMKTETRVKVDEGKPVVYTGCVGSMQEAQSFVLENAVPVAMRQTKTESSIDAAGLPQTTTTTTTKYVLVPGDKVDLSRSLGSKVEVTAILIPAGKDKDKVKVDTTSKTEVNGKRTQEIETKEKIPQGPMPQLRVLSVKQVSDRCPS
jgi:hypothetical protein